jgi:hypothetical protein
MHQHCRAGRAEDKGEQGAQPGQRDVEGAQRHTVGHRGHDAGHMRCVLLDGKEAAGIDGAGHKGQRIAQVTVGIGRAHSSCHLA